MQFHYLSLILTKALNLFLLQPPSILIPHHSNRFGKFKFFSSSILNRIESQPKMASSRTATKDIITLRGSAAIVSEFFGMQFSNSTPSDQFLWFWMSISLLGCREIIDWSLYFVFICNFSIRLFSKQVMGMGSLSLFLLFMLSIGVCPILGLWIFNLKTNLFENWGFSIAFCTIEEYIPKKVLSRSRNMGCLCCSLRMRDSNPSLPPLLLSFLVWFYHSGSDSETIVFVSITLLGENVVLGHSHFVFLIS